ncbi:MAG: tail fiber domain-containing protein [Phaeodactylibacter sp.]|nr:tail fiber domain-containing protein [Phaeodactylibacter sp.]
MRLPKITFLFLVFVVQTSLFAQVPFSFSYQAVLRDAGGVITDPVNLKVFILDGASTVVYEEQHTSLLPNQYGMVNLNIGEQDATAFAAVNWPSGNFSLSLELNGAPLGTPVPILSVPFALHANSAEYGEDADADPQNELQQLGLSGSTLFLSPGGGSVSLPTPTQAWTESGGNVYRSTGAVGIGTTDVSTYKTRVSHGSYGFDLERNSTGDDWEFYVSGGNLYLYANGDYKGYFDETNGNYVPGSDRRLKSDIQPLSPVLDQVMQLKPSSYRFKSASYGEGEHSIGFIAQEVQDVFPNLVGQPGDAEDSRTPYLSVNYTGFSVVAIQAIQEQQALIEALRAELEVLKMEVEGLKE